METSLRRWAGRHLTNELMLRTRPVAPQAHGLETPALFDLGFLKFNVLAYNGIVFLEGQLLGAVSRVLLGDIKEAGSSGAQELDLLGDRLSHDSSRGRC
jgi:hypothetical protein